MTLIAFATPNNQFLKDGINKMFTSTKKPREEFIEGIYSISKVILGAVIGTISGLLDLNVIFGVLFWIGSVGIWFLLFKYIVNLEENPIKLILLYGTFASFVAFILFWGIFLGPP
ncbi:MAG: hypothetical protein ACP6IP_00260 [Candidatus Njordarchaeia archaeon]